MAVSVTFKSNKYIQIPHHLIHKAARRVSIIYELLIKNNEIHNIPFHFSNAKKVKTKTFIIYIYFNQILFAMA